MRDSYDIIRYLEAYRREAFDVLSGQRARRRPRGPLDDHFGFVDSYRPPEVAALESFLVIFRGDEGILIYGVPLAAKVHEHAKFRERHQDIFILETPPRHGEVDLQAEHLDAALWSHWWPPIRWRGGVVAYLARNALIPYFNDEVFWHGNQYPYRRISDHWRRFGECFSVIASENMATLPEPRELAWRIWAHLRIERRRFERNVGSFRQAASLAQRLEELLARATREQDLHFFLEDHPEVIAPDFVKCYSKFRLADEFVTDFVVLRETGYEFIEIERPNKPIFTKSGQFHHLLTQAENQLLDWRILLEKETNFFESRLPGLHRPSFRLIYGREVELDDQRTRKIRSHFTDIQFDTYDSILRRFRQTVDNLLDERPRHHT